MPRSFEYDPGYSEDERAIEEGIQWAELSEQPIDDTTARMMASHLHTGIGSALYSLASTGSIKYQQLYYEMLRDFTTPEADETNKRWLNVLARYRDWYGDRESVEGWSELWRGPEFS